MGFSHLPEDILSKIVKDHLHCFSQLFPFSAVCRSWRSAARRDHRLRLPCLLVSPFTHQDYHEFKPLAQFPAALRQQEEQYWRVRIPLGFRHIVPRRAAEADWRVTLEDEWYYRPRNNPCVATKSGWVLVIQPRAREPLPEPVKPYLLNPITREFIALPLLRTKEDGAAITLGQVRRAVITSSPDDYGCHVIIAFDVWELAWCEVAAGRGQDWKFTSLSRVPWIADATYFGGKLYLVEHYSVHVFDNLPTGHVTIPFSPAMRDFRSYAHETSAYLSRLNDDQLLVVLRRFRREPEEWFHDFRAYKLLLRMPGYEWEEVRSLEGHALFLSYSHESICVRVAPDYCNDVVVAGVREDRIYFAFSHDYGYQGSDDYYDSDVSRNDCGVFNLSDQRMESYACGPLRDHDYYWFLPVPW